MKILSFAATGGASRTFCHVKEVRKRKINTLCSHLYMETKNICVIEVKSRIVVSSVWEGQELGRGCLMGTKL
jgi:hypothetical protein